MAMQTTDSDNRSTMLKQYGVAVVAVAVALGVTSSLWPVLRYVPLAAIFTAVTASAWIGGRGPGLVATTLATLGYAYLFLPPFSSLSVDDEQDAIRLVLFTIVAGLISILTGRLKAAEAENARLTAIIKRTPFKR